LSVTVLGKEFQVAGAEQQKACLANAALANGSVKKTLTAFMTIIILL